MRKRFWLALAMLAAGVSLIAAAALAGPAKSSPAAKASPSVGASKALKKGGTLRVNIPGGDVDDIDPVVAYGTTSWEIEYATSLRLLNYPDAPAPKGSRLVPEGASGYTVSKDGKTYTFTIKKGFRFSNGQAVTARNYEYAINRSLFKAIQSPAFQFISDPNAVNILGSQAVRDGKANKASGVSVKGNKLIIKMSKRDATFLAKISMPFFQAIPLNLPADKKVISVSASSPLASAGPYYVAEREPNRVITVKRNTFYKGSRPHNLAQINFTVGVNLESGYRQVLAGEADYQLGLPPTSYAELARQFGINARGGRFRVQPSNCTSYMALNNANPLFSGNVALRKAVNFAVSRTQIVQQYGVAGGVPTDQVLPPTFPGFVNAKLYPLGRPNVAQAQKLARGKTRSGKGVIYYGLTSPGPQTMEIVRADLKRIGIDLEPQGFRGFAIYDAAGKRGSEHAMTIGTGWCQDYPDPYDFINVLLYGGAIQQDNNNNIAYFNTASYNKKMERAARLVGAARLKAYGNLDVDIMKNQAPWAAYRIPNNRQFFSNRVDMRSYIYQPVYEAPIYNALALK